MVDALMNSDPDPLMSPKIETMVLFEVEVQWLFLLSDVKVKPIRANDTL
jgi:hypothetical protein